MAALQCHPMKRWCGLKSILSLPWALDWESIHSEYSGKRQWNIWTSTGIFIPSCPIHSPNDTLLCIFSSYLYQWALCFPTECMTMVIICTGCYIIIVPFVIRQCYDTFLPNTVECLLTSWEPLTHEWIFTLNYGKAIPQKKKTSPKSLEILTVYKELIWFHIYKY